MMRKRKKRRQTAKATATASIGNKGGTAKATTARARGGGRPHRTCNVCCDESCILIDPLKSPIFDCFVMIEKDPIMETVKI